MIEPMFSINLVGRTGRTNKNLINIGGVQYSRCRGYSAGQLKTFRCHTIYKTQRQRGLTLTELLVTITIATIIMTGLAGIISQALQAEDATHAKNQLTQQTRFAMQRMVAALRGSQRLLLPLGDNPATDWREHVREQTVPPSPPEGSSSKATAVLAMTLDPSIDRNGDGWADANNDRDYMDINNNGVRDKGEPERIDEDLGSDMTNDAVAGIKGIDDNGDGSTDIESIDDDDEDGKKSEELPNGQDNDLDGSIGEDLDADANQDSKAGIAGQDDDFDTLIDEGGKKEDDDEDGLIDEDWLDPVVFEIQGTRLVERYPSLSDTNNDSLVTGADYSEHVIAENVSRFRVERVQQAAGQPTLVDITLEQTDTTGQVFSLRTRVRVGAGR